MEASTLAERGEIVTAAKLGDPYQTAPAALPAGGRQIWGW